MICGVENVKKPSNGLVSKSTATHHTTAGEAVSPAGILTTQYFLHYLSAQSWQREIALLLCSFGLVN